MPNFELHIYGEEQKQYIEKLKIFLNNKIKGRKPIAYIRTYGCQQNVADSEKYKGILSEIGFEFSDTYENADLILFNTCAVRENAENRVFGNIGRVKAVKRKNPNSCILLAGCMTQQKKIADKVRDTYKFIDIILGTDAIYNFPKIIFDYFAGEKSKKCKIYIDEKDSVIESFPMVKNNKIKAFVNIMSGCNNFCTYCIVPYVRGRERSRMPDKIINEVKSLLENGYKDITLLGQNVNSYGKDLDINVDFCYLLKELDKLDYDFKLRFMTSHPKDATEKLFDTIAESKHISHHIHLPVQCGSDSILEKMNRKYTSKQYLEKIKYAKNKIKDVTFTSDIIVGFPGETYEDFLKTIDLIKEVEFSSLFTFIYSKRDGTPAAKLPDNISKEEKTSWLLELLKVQEEISQNLCKKMVGREERVLAENYENGFLLCRTDGNIVVKVLADASLCGKFINIIIKNANKESLEGKLL